MHLVTMLRMCGAQSLNLPVPITNITVNGSMPPTAEGGLDSHTLLGPLMPQSGSNVFLGTTRLPAVAAIKDMAGPDVLALTPHVQGLPIPMQGSPNVFIGQGTASAGIGMMQQLGLGSFGPLSIGEFVSVAGQIIGQVANFTQIGGGAAVAQLSNLQGMPISPGTTVIGLASGYTFTFANYFDSRTYDNVPGGASYSSANSYADIATYSASSNVITNTIGTDYDYILSPNLSDGYVMDDGEIVISDYVDTTASYIVISDYDDLSPSLNLTAATIVTDIVANTEIDYIYTFTESGDLLMTDDGSLLALG